MPTSDGGQIFPLLLVACILLGVGIGGVAFFVTSAFASHGGDFIVSAAIGTARRRALRERGRQSSTLFAWAVSVVEVITPLVSILPLDWLKEAILPRYAKAGWPGGLEDEELVGLTVLISVILALVLLLLIGPTLGFPFVIFAFVGLLLGPVLVGNDLATRAQERDRSIVRSMPFVLDLLVLTMRSGASLPIAIERVAKDYQSKPVGDEFQATLREIEMGTTRRDAFMAMAERTGLPVIRTFVDDVLQADELGRPVADTLARLSERIRSRRLQEAQETAGKAKVKVLLPGMLVFVAVLILLFSPFLLRYLYLSP